MHEGLFDKLSPRKQDCLRGVADLKSAKEIGRDLDISEHTVRGYIAEAVKEVGARDRTEAARMFREYELRTSPPQLRGQSSRVADHARFAPPQDREPTDVPGFQDSETPSYTVDRPNDFRLADKGGVGNDYSTVQRLVFIVVAATVIALLVMLAVNLAETLTRLGHTIG
ncbi:MAG: hypothetical protein CMN72_16580 [Sphingomonas sp.]|nr:hypothetical protein [Sphingomonas sp.]